MTGCKTAADLALTGLYGFDARGPTFFRLHYWGDLLKILRGKIGAEVIVTAVPGCVRRVLAVYGRSKLSACAHAGPAQSRTVPEYCTAFWKAWRL